MRLESLDLNLLLILDALVAERNMTRAAKRVGLSQPAMSSALARAQSAAADDLKTSNPPTPKASARRALTCRAVAPFSGAKEEHSINPKSEIQNRKSKIENVLPVVVHLQRRLVQALIYLLN